MTSPKATPAEIFIAEHRLEHSESDEVGPLWAGMSACDNEPFELFFRADKNGPTETQLACYNSFVDSYREIRGRIQQAFRSHLPSLGQEVARKFQDRRTEFDIVTFQADEAEYEIVVYGRASRGWAIFSSHLLFAVELRDNEVIQLRTD